MNTKLSRRARLLAGIGAGAVLLGLTATACDSSPAAAPAPSPTPSHTATSSPAPTTTTTSTTPAPVGAGDGTSSPRPTTTSAKPAPVPTLGTAWSQSQEGYGTVRPSTVFNGGDPTGMVFNLSWQSWGGPTAIGTGRSYDPTGKPSVAQSVENQATVVAFDLGECKGQLMYRAIEWYFPSDGQKFSPNNYINICTGQYVGSP